MRSPTQHVSRPQFRSSGTCEQGNHNPPSNAEWWAPVPSCGLACHMIHGWLQPKLPILRHQFLGMTMVGRADGGQRGSGWFQLAPTDPGSWKDAKGINLHHLPWGSLVQIRPSAGNSLFTTIALRTAEGCCCYHGHEGQPARHELRHLPKHPRTTHLGASGCECVFDQTHVHPRVDCKCAMPRHNV